MLRQTATLAAFLVLSAWAGAQAPATPALTAAERLKLHRANRTLLADLVDSGVKLGGASHPVARAELCQGTARVLGIALRNAAEAQDPDRVGELGAHLTRVVRDGLVPILEEGRQTVPAESPDAVRLRAVRESAAGDLNGVRSAIPATGKVAASDKVRTLCGALDGLRDQLK